MTFKTKKLSLDDIDLFSNDKQRELFRIWDSNKLMDSRLLNLSDELVIYGPPDGNFLPPMYHGGHKSLAAQIMGPGWRQHMSKIDGSDMISSAYQEVFDSKPVWEFCYYEGKRHVTWERLILLFYTKYGAPHLINLCSVFSLSDTIDPAPNHQDQIGLSQQTNMVLLGSDKRPNSNSFLSE